MRQPNNEFPIELPSLLHGDLWSGNFMMTVKGPYVFDPAVHNGHREMDIGMTFLFGGFDQQFYDAYNEIYPLEKDWNKRLHLTQLYPLLVHAILFDGSYVARVIQTLQKYS
ncbi:MAG: fructosamine kinase family protein [Chitinophagaceae bacterium]|nr:fructosamine kinase family protein [Chitinophagaceae bacterium]